MSHLAWIVLGLIAGFVCSKVVDNTGQGLVVDLLLSIVGAVVGAMVVPWLYHALAGRLRVL